MSVSGADHLRRLALQIAAQLPEDENEARYVLDRAGDILHGLALAPRLDAAIRPDGREHRILQLVPAAGRGAPSGPLGTTSPK